MQKSKKCKKIKSRAGDSALMSVLVKRGKDSDARKLPKAGICKELQQGKIFLRSLILAAYQIKGGGFCLHVCACITGQRQ